MMKIVSCAALIALACCVAYVPLTEAGQEMVERAGHFAQIRFASTIYHFYASALGENLSAKDGDTVNYRPDIQQCLPFLDSHSREFRLERLVDIIKLDACLGVLYDEKDANGRQGTEISRLKDVEHFKKFYHTTKINGFNQFKLACIANLLVGSVSGRAQFQYRLNDHYLQLFSQFGACIKNSKVTKKNREDPYLKMILELVSKETKEALETIVNTLKKLIHEVYEMDKLGNIKNKIKSMWSREAVMELKKKIPRPVRELLSITKDENENLNWRGVHQRINQLYSSEYLFEIPDEKIKTPEHEYLKRSTNRFLDRIARRATEAIVKKGNAGDIKGDGSKNYLQWKDQLCAPFRISDSEMSNDFALKLQRLVDITKFSDLFGLEEQELLSSIVVKAESPAGLYLSLVFCNFLDFTTATLPVNVVTNDLIKQDFKIQNKNADIDRRNNNIKVAKNSEKSVWSKLFSLGRKPEESREKKMPRTLLYKVTIETDRGYMQRWPLLDYI